MTTKKAIQGLILAGALLLLGELLKGEEQIAFLPSLIAVAVTGLAAVLFALLQILRDRGLKKRSLSDMLTYRVKNDAFISQGFVFLMLYGQMLMPRLNGGFRTIGSVWANLLLLVPVAVALVFILKRKDLRFDDGASPEMILRRAVQRELQAEKHGGITANALLTILLLLGMAAGVLYYDSAALASNGAYLPHSASAILGFFCLSLSCLRQDDLVQQAVGDPKSDVGTLVGKSRRVGKCALAVCAALVLGMGAFTAAQFSEQDTANPLAFRENGDGGYTLVTFRTWVPAANARELAIPESYRGKPVTAIADGVFMGKAVEAVTIPASVTSIGANAFKNSGLVSVTVLGEPSLGEGAFANTKIREYTLPENMEMVPADLFNGCGSLEAICLPESLKTIGSQAFAGTGLQAVDIPAGVTDIEADAFVKCASLTEVTMAGSPVLHAGAFQETGLREAVLPEGMTEIPARLFAGCANLRKAVIPDGVTDIHVDAFAACTLLTEVTMTGSPVLHAGAFRRTGLREVILPEGATAIPARLFAGCSQLTDLKIPESVTEIGASAFEKCSGLTEITIPASVKDIHEKAFLACANLKAVAFEGCPEIHASVFSQCGFETFAFPEGTGKVHAGVLESCGSLTDVNLPESVTEIGARAFGYCTGLTEVSLPEGVTEIGAHAFEKCTGLGKIILPESCMSVGASAFAASGIAEISFPSRMESIDSEAFRDCKNLTKLDLPQGITSVRADLCQSCTALTSVTIPEGVVEIRAHAFQGCSRLSAVSLPSTLKSVGSSAFRSCSFLRSITLPQGCTYEDNSFKDSPVYSRYPSRTNTKKKKKK